MDQAVLDALVSIQQRLDSIERKQDLLSTQVDSTNADIGHLTRSVQETRALVHAVNNKLINKGRKFYTALSDLPLEVLSRILAYIHPATSSTGPDQSHNGYLISPSHKVHTAGPGIQSVLKFRRVSRSFNAVLLDPHFVTKNLKHHLITTKPPVSPPQRVPEQDAPPFPLSSTSNLAAASKTPTDMDKAWFAWPPTFQNAYLSARLHQLTEIDWKNTEFCFSGIPKAIEGFRDGVGLTHLTLYRCKLSGVIPPEIGYLKLLVTLRLDDNNLTGFIPAEIESLTNLNYLCLDHNSLSGLIPHQLGALTQLKIMNLRHNCFSGRVPVELGRLDKLTTLYMSGSPELELVIPEGITAGGVVWNLMRREGFR
ncbi:hypothetical protein CcCBS67573_g01868 [Chytriomyces confervae]|uniref:Uncharacterized protein n=1 Tax=Chytriomyces confervae TaxID=246404 RepID=A0A507FNF8_9FUNG|nr:hypothetical protein HDU80_008267 [Chytriomyces hyalinus]TPX76866.1 hypothetical protein CcCBS67573_g01868 [Chytriomyces confervae]